MSNTTNRYLLLFVFIIATYTPIWAQPVIMDAEAWSPGMVFKLANCPGAAAGPAGADIRWDFSWLPTTDTITLSIQNTPAGCIYPEATMLEKYSDSLNYFISRSSGTNYIIGMIDSSVRGNNDSIRYPNSVVATVRPLIYGTVVTDVFTMATIHGSGIPVSGTGDISILADAWGTLALPGHTYHPVLRVFASESSTFHLGGGGSFTQTIRSYKWYDAQNKPPLLRIDSIEATYFPTSGGSITTSGHKVRYLLAANHTQAGLTSLQGLEAPWRVGIAGNQITLTNESAATKNNSLTIKDLQGRTYYATTFNTGSPTTTLYTDTYLPAGMYLINIMDNTGSSAPCTLRVLKH